MPVVSCPAHAQSLCPDTPTLKSPARDLVVIRQHGSMKRCLIGLGPSSRRLAPRSRALERCAGCASPRALFSIEPQHAMAPATSRSTSRFLPGHQKPIRTLRNSPYQTSASLAQLCPSAEREALPLSKAIGSIDKLLPRPPFDTTRKRNAKSMDVVQRRIRKLLTKDE